MLIKYTLVAAIHGIVVNLQGTISLKKSYSTFPRNCQPPVTHEPYKTLISLLMAGYGGFLTLPYSVFILYVFLHTFLSAKIPSLEYYVILE